MLQGGIHSVNRILDFGTLTSLQQKIELPLVLLNCESVPVTVSRIKLDKPDAGISYDFSPVTIQPKENAVVLNITYSGNFFFLPVLTLSIGQSKGQFRGSLYVYTTSSLSQATSFEVPYKARVIPGSVDYNVFDTHFIAST